MQDLVERTKFDSCFVFVDLKALGQIELGCQRLFRLAPLVLDRVVRGVPAYRQHGRDFQSRAPLVAQVLRAGQWRRLPASWSVQASVR